MVAQAVFDPWLADPPACDAYLPGGVCDIDITPRPNRPIRHRDVSTLHGMISALMGDLAGVRHHERIPRFSMMPSPAGVGWGVYMDLLPAVRALAQQCHPARLGDRLVVARFGVIRRVRAPLIPWRGRRVVHVEAITPVIVRRTIRPKDTGGAAGHRMAMHTCPTSENLLHAITQSYLDRLGLPASLAADVRLELLARDTRGSKPLNHGVAVSAHGWLGTVVLAVNAPAAWLLRCAETTGLGGRTAYGFGRIVVREC